MLIVSRPLNKKATLLKNARSTIAHSLKFKYQNVVFASEVAPTMNSLHTRTTAPLCLKYASTQLAERGPL